MPAYREPALSTNTPFMVKVQAKTSQVIQFTKDMKDTRKTSFMYPAEQYQGKRYLLIRFGNVRTDNAKDAFKWKVVLTLEL